MKNNYFIIYLLFLLTISTPINTMGQQLEMESSEKVQIDWLKALNNSINLNPFYSEGSGIMLNDKLYVGIEEINKQLLALKKDVGKFNSYEILEVYQLRDNRKIVLGEYKTISGNVYSTIIGWRNRDKWTKEFEVIYNNNDYSILEIDSVNKARNNWVKLSNQHRPDLIVDEIYSGNGKYFNRGNQYSDREIIEVYSYMYNESHRIKLEPLKVLQINSDIVFDIGTFEIGGKGLYMLIWKKEFDTWKILLDFNF